MTEENKQVEPLTTEQMSDFMKGLMFYMTADNELSEEEKLDKAREIALRNLKEEKLINECNDTAS